VTSGIIVQRRIPTYDAVIHTSLSPHAVHLRLEQFFVLGRERPRGFFAYDPRFYGEFEGETSFVVRLGSILRGRSYRPVIDGYFVVDPKGGTDIFLRAAYPNWLWAIQMGVIAFIGLAAALSQGLVTAIMMLPVIAILASIYSLMLIMDGSNFAYRIRTLFPEA
jgi:hypothetical protein